MKTKENIKKVLKVNSKAMTAAAHGTELKQWSDTTKAGLPF